MASTKSIKSDIKLSDIGSGQPSLKSDKVLMTTDEMEMNRVKVEYNTELNIRKTAVQFKIDDLNMKLKKHELKEGMLDIIIGQTYTEMSNLSENEFTRRGQKQSILIKQMEALSILHDTLLKYEAMIQSYHKIMLDIENNKLNSYIKVVNLKKEEKKTDEGLSAILMDLQEMMKGSNGPGPSGSPLLDDLKQELLEGDY